MNSKPQVSVIIIFLNAEKFIDEAIDSVFAQTYESWELLLVDDGSMDASTKIALRWRERNPTKVLYLEHDRHQWRGTGASRNLGVRNARGEYVDFLDADDVWMSRKLEQQTTILTSHPGVAMVYGPCRYWSGWTGIPKDIEREKNQEIGVQPDTVVNPPALFVKLLQKEGCMPIGVLLRRSAIERVGGFEESFTGLYEDRTLVAKLCLEFPVFVAGECWYKYRQHPDSYITIAERFGGFDRARPIYLDWLAGYLSRQQVKDRTVWTALNAALWPYRHPILHHLLRPELAVGQTKRLLKHVARRTLPAPVRRWLRRSV